MDKGYYIGGTTGIFKNIKDNSKICWIIPTIKNYIENIKYEKSQKIFTLPLECSAMNFNSINKVMKARDIILKMGPVAEIMLDERNLFYRISILKEKYVIKERNKLKIPAVKLRISDSLIRILYNKLLPIVAN